MYFVYLIYLIENRSTKYCEDLVQKLISPSEEKLKCSEIIFWMIVKIELIETILRFSRNAVGFIVQISFLMTCFSKNKT